MNFMLLRLNNFQDRIMISITCMLIISTIQSSIDKMVPKTSYFKMVDLFLLYSFNIVIIIMAVHTYMDMVINRDEVSQTNWQIVVLYEVNFVIRVIEIILALVGQESL